MLAEGTRPQDSRRRPSRPTQLLAVRQFLQDAHWMPAPALSRKPIRWRRSKEVMVTSRDQRMDLEPRQLAAPQAQQMKVGADWGVA